MAIGWNHDPVRILLDERPCALLSAILVGTVFKPVQSGADC